MKEQNYTPADHCLDRSVNRTHAELLSLLSPPPLQLPDSPTWATNGQGTFEGRPPRPSLYKP